MDTPLHSLDAEYSVIGSCLFSNTAYDRIADIVTADDFSRQSHRDIWAAINHLGQDGNPTDIVTVSEQMQQQGTLDDAGGFAYLGVLARDTPSAVNVEAYANIMREYSLRRKMLVAGKKITALATNDGEENRLAQAYSELEVLHDPRKQEPVKAFSVLPQLLEEISKRVEQTDDLLGLPTGIKQLDNAINGLCPGRFYVVAGRPGMGKSVLGLQCALRAAIADKSALFVSLEMSREELMMRSAANVQHIELNRLEHAKDLDDDDYSKLTGFLSKVEHMPLWIDDSASLHINEIAARARRHKRQYKLDLLVIDYIQLVRGDGENRTKEVGQISRTCKQLAKDLHIPVLALSQLNRSVEQRGNKRPIMSDLRESGEIEQDSDVVMFLYRDEVYYEDSAEHGIAEIIVAKQRNGTIGTRKAAWLGKYAAIDNLAFEDLARAQSQPRRKQEYFA